MVSIVVPLIFAANFTVFMICHGMPWISDENYELEESGDFQLQPREPVTLIILSVIFMIRRLVRLARIIGRKHNPETVAPRPYSAHPASPVYRLPTPPNASTGYSFKIFLWNTYESWQRKLNVNFSIPPHLQSTWGKIKLSLWNMLEKKKRNLKLFVPGYPGYPVQQG